MENNDAMKAPENLENKGEEVKDTGTMPESTEEENVANTEVSAEVEETTEETPETVDVSDKPIKEEKREFVLETVDHLTLSKEKLVIRLKTVLDKFPVNEIRDEVVLIKNAFSQKQQEEVNTTKAHFIEQGGEEKDFLMPPDPQQDVMKELLNQYRERKNAYQQDLESEKEKNVKLKYEVIEEIKSLIDNEESLNQTFKAFRKLQDKWRDIGTVPQGNLKDLWENYHHHVENFYDYIKINKELRDLDFKKNYEAKLELCEKAEALVDVESPQEAFDKLQVLHEEWREIGPVEKEHREKLWERFREATRIVNKRNQKFYDDLRKQQKENLVKKAALCEMVEGIGQEAIDKPQLWNEKASDIQKIQKDWRDIGPAPKKNNDEIFERFRAACDAFFEKKRTFYNSYKQEKENNLEAKKALCEKAEALKDSTEWKSTTDELIQIQRDWKKIGPVPRKYSDSIWKRFREACDHFFNQKANFFKDIDSIQHDNLMSKKALIEEIEKFEIGEDIQQCLGSLHEYKERWNKIGHVPFPEKDAIYNLYRNAINRHYDKLNLDEYSRELEKFKSKLEDLTHSQNSGNRIGGERNKLVIKKRQLENDIQVWENNIGFFSSSKKSSSFVTEFEKKIEKAKERLKLIDEKIDLLDSSD